VSGGDHSAGRRRDGGACPRPAPVFSGAWTCWVELNRSFCRVRQRIAGVFPHLTPKAQLLTVCSRRQHGDDGGTAGRVFYSCRR
jgi:hypothetical protein